jgi:hypothetical protein
MKTFFNLYKVPKIIKQHTNNQNANKFQASGFFQNAQFFGQNEKNKFKHCNFTGQHEI